MNKLSLGDIYEILSKQLLVYKKTVFFKKGGGLLFALLVVVSLYTTLLLSPSFETTSLPNTSISRTTACTPCTGGWIEIGGEPQYNFTGQCGVPYKDPAGAPWICCDPGGNAGWTRGSACPNTERNCPVIQIIDTQTGAALPAITGTPNQGVCASDHKNYKCDGSRGSWVPDTQFPGYCGGAAPTVGACQCTGGSVKVNGTVNNNYTARCGETVCGSDNKSYECVYPGGGSEKYVYRAATCQGSGGGGSGGGGSVGTCDQQAQAKGYANLAAACQSINQTACPGTSCKCTPNCPGGSGGGSGGGGGGSGATPTPATGGGGGGSAPTPTPATGGTGGGGTGRGGGGSGTIPTPTTSVVSTPTVPTPTGSSLTTTPTPTPGAAMTDISLTAVIDGVGLQENNSPIPNQRALNLVIVGTNGKEINAPTTLTYNSTNGNFAGNSQTSLTSGFYTFKIKFDNTLSKAIRNVQVTGGQKVTLPSTKLTSGDLNGDNVLNLVDYNSLLSYINKKSDPSQTPAGTPVPPGDLNMDNIIDEADLNLLFSQFKTRGGD